MLHFTVVSGAVTSIHFSPIYMSITLSWSFSWVLFKPKSTLLSLEPIILFYTTQLKSIFFFFFLSSLESVPLLYLFQLQKTLKDKSERDTHTQKYERYYKYMQSYIYIARSMAYLKIYLKCKWWIVEWKISINPAFPQHLIILANLNYIYIYIYISAIQKVYIRQGRQKKS